MATTIRFGDITATGRYYAEAIASLESMTGRRINDDSVQTHLCGKCAPSSAARDRNNNCPNWIVN